MRNFVFGSMGLLVAVGGISVACSSSSSSTPAPTDDAGTTTETGGGEDAASDAKRGGDPAVNSYVTGLPAWVQPPPDSDVTTNVGTVTRDKTTSSGKVRFSCKQTKHDVLKGHTSILSLGASQSNLKPGILLQGTPYRNGTLQSLPIPRSPATLSIDLPVPTPTVTVENPDSASLQQAVATLQIAASSQLTNLPALVAFSRQESTSQTQMSLQIGASGQYSSALTSVNFQAAFSKQDTQEQHTVVAQLMQPMYTISFADDAIADPSLFFASTVTEADLKHQEALGTIGAENLPVFVSSVTYGRLVVFTATSSQATSATQITAALDASVGAFKGTASLDLQTKNFLSSLQIEVLAIGGNAAAVGQSIVSGDYNGLFGSADATSAVPLKFAVKNLAGTRPPAGIGDALQFVEESCTPMTSVGWTEAKPSVGAPLFKQVSVGRGGHVWAVANSGADVYRYDGTNMVLVDSGLTDKVLEMAVNDDGTAYGLRASNIVQKHNAAGPGFITNASLEFGKVLHVDIAGDQIIGLGLNSEFYTYTAANGWQNLRPGMGAGSSISAIDAGHAWFRSGTSATPGVPTYTITYAGGGIVQQSATPGVVPSAASAAEVWGLDDAKAVRKYNFGTNAWDPSPYPAPSEAIVALDAGPGNNVWVVTGTGKLLHYVQ